ncbi:HlyD family efflux transporter periplasmic adaptor subunit [Metallumcola ferriviriculae]|uniref:HlyD family efflux transporter periplasmic adaptor subunit n=1 Tax=Metallumcola ferriviriculae TaxID=3039180 RepID=A0AAU0UKD9_9FIRM|nr:HlyD family efflux transporter periplasmic adaptor subunit [Desulfitibacteraceae bacterium MK1]
MSKKIFGLIILAIVLLLAGCTGEQDLLEVSGTVEALEVDLSSQVSGEVVAVKVEEGTQVKKGDLLTKLDETGLALRKRQAQAVLNTLEAQYAELKSGSRKQQLAQAAAQVNQAAAGVEAANDVLATAETELNRIRKLYSAGAVSQQKLNQAELSYNQAQSSYRAAVSQRQAAEAQYSLVKEGAAADALRSAAAQVENAEAALESVEWELAKTEITAPKDGVILSVNIREGELARPGIPLFTLGRMDTLYVETYIPEPWLSRVELGQAVTLGVDGLGEEISGKLTHIASEAEFTPQNVQTKEKRADTVYAAKVKVEQGKRVLKPGMPVDVYIHPRDKKDADSI